MSKKLSIKDMALCALFAALSAAGAFIKIPFGIVPFTLQTMFTCLAGLLLGKKRGAAAVALYVFLGLVGLPVFTEGGGIGYVLMPTFGYLIGMIAGAYLAGAIAEKGGGRLSAYFTACAAFLAIVYVIGMAYLYIIRTFYMGSAIELKTLLVYCCLVFLPSDIATCALAVLLARRLKPLAD